MAVESEEQLLSATYQQLDFNGGVLLDAVDVPGNISAKDWITKGGWLSLAKKVGADKVFFVDDNPVIVFVKGSKSDSSWHRTFNRVWCMARPPLLFIARQGELTVYDLTQAPVREAMAADASATHLLQTIATTVEIATKLQEFHRARIETGQLFQERNFSFETRADRALVNDLRIVRRELLNHGLSVPHAHALIGRSILIRYLEDRRILVEQYFRDVADQNADWHRLIDIAPAVRHGDDRRAFYTSVLTNKSFTDALFAKLAKDFNGDLFPFDDQELKAFSAKRLDLIRKFLIGELEGDHLFFFAYDFEIVPIDLVSTIYEEFLKTKKGKANTQGSFYTPGALVDFVLSSTLDEEMLNKRPRVVDPACGSGIFLVESFQRIVRHRERASGRDLSSDELKQILNAQIRGIDVNGEAIRVAAFSLYLALLNFLKPPDILGHQLPSLAYTREKKRNCDESFNILLEANAFDIAASVDDAEVLEKFGSCSADVVVGNPPWGQPKEQDEETRTAAKAVMEWCATGHRAVGDKELSQAFVHRIMDLLCEGGRAGLLLSSGVLFKRANKSRMFRKQWLENVCLNEVVNFAAVRQVFFVSKGRSVGSIAPFVSVTFVKGNTNKSKYKFRYFSAKRTAFVSELQAVLLSRPDLHILSQAKFMADDDLWKIYWWGGHRDEALINSLRTEEQLGLLLDPEGKHPERFGSGFKQSRNRRTKAKFLSRFKELPTRSFIRYGPLPKDHLVAPPQFVERERHRCIYEGSRLLVKAGIEEKDGANGRIVSRLESGPFCFRHSIYGLRLQNSLVHEAKVLLGILWSSLTRYFLWLTSGRWGLWHNDILIETLARLPVRTPRSAKLRRRLEAIIDELRGASANQGALFGDDATLSPKDIVKLERQLDDVVFDLFDLDISERDAIRDMCSYGLDLFYRGDTSMALKPIPFSHDTKLFGERTDSSPAPDAHQIHQYIDAFLEIWVPELASDGHFLWEIVASRHSPMIAVIFSTHVSDECQPTKTDPVAWDALLKRLASASRCQHQSLNIYIDAVTRVVGEHEIVIIKRNERRLWTRTAAREDAEATILDAARREQLANTR